MIQEAIGRTPACPICRAPAEMLDEKTKIRNLALKELIDEWKEQERVPSFCYYISENQRLAKSYLATVDNCLEQEDYEGAFEAFGQVFKHTKRSEDYARVPALYEQLKERDRATLSYLYLASYQLDEGKILEALETLEKVSLETPTAL